MPMGPVNVGLAIAPGVVALGVEQAGRPPIVAPLDPENARKFGVAIITAAYQAELEAKRLQDLKAQAKAELDAHPSNQEQQPGEPAPAPHTAPSSPGPIIVLP